MHLAIITAGGAGMFCGSCMHDNTWARALHQAGTEVSLIPLYTPIRVDEENQTSSPLFFGGINTYLNDHVPFWGRLPRFMTHWLDSPWLIQLATRGGVSNDAAELGSMTATMLLGESGPHRQAVDELADFVGQLKPDVVCFSNSLLVGSLRALRQRYAGRVYCVLQGDDVFLDGLVEPHRSLVMSRLKERAAEFDGYIVHSRFYADYMSQYLDLPRNRFIELPLAVDCANHDGRPKSQLGSPPTVGYFARICPEKGFDLIVDSVLRLKKRIPDIRLRTGGYLGKQNEAYFRKICRLAEPLGDAFEYIGSPATHAEKVAFYKSLDVFSVPARFQEPKGLYVLEAWANGLPVVLPRHAALPELIQSTGGGLLAEPEDPDSIADRLWDILQDRSLRTDLANRGYEGVRRNHDLTTLASATIRHLQG
ncbi:glycosyltransferase family 4 protein [Schlesneria paludicola]|uniref:glycosyltransferase family 4 protein n=1 Tax=Schlesneria paludicola TaxID=360056 RepID=UPI000299D60A|nr:glycosyltransferase family 4 protein [Schlesneria paludicola]